MQLNNLNLQHKTPPRNNTSQNSQAKADVLRSSKRQSFGSPMMDKALFPGVGEYSDETKIWPPAQESYSFSWSLPEGLGHHFRKLKVHPSLLCGGTKAKGLKDTNCLTKANLTHSHKFTGCVLSDTSNMTVNSKLLQISLYTFIFQHANKLVHVRIYCPGGPVDPQVDVFMTTEFR